MDYIYVFCIGFFGLVCLASQAFWFYHYNKLLNKFMSRNYSDFVQAEKVLTSQPKKKAKEEPIYNDHDVQRAKEINGLFGMGG